jgi:tetratricopeptide (TPR) repeat protein
MRKSAMKISMKIIPTIAALAVAAAGGGCTKAARSSRGIERGDRYFQAGQMDKAEASYQSAARLLNPYNPAALRQLGLLYFAEGRTLMALKYLGQSAKTEPDNAVIQADLAALWISLGGFAEAADAAKKALQVQPGNQDALVALCNSARNAQEVEETRQYSEKMRRQDKDKASYHLALAMLDMRVRNIPEAQREKNLAAAGAELDKAKTLDPKSAFAQMALADLAMNRNDHRAAEQAFKAALQLAPPRSPVPVQYAEFQVDLGATNQARDTLLEEVRKTPDYITPLLALMRLSFAEKNYDESATYVRQILAHDPGNYDAMMEQGAISLAKLDAKQAVADYEKITLPLPLPQYKSARARLWPPSRS